MKYYVKVTETVAKAIISSGVPLTKTKDGNVLLYQSELNGVEGDNLSERARNIGGSLVPDINAVAEIDGTIDNPASCHTPKAYGGEDESSAQGDINEDKYNQKESEVTNE